MHNLNLIEALGLDKLPESKRNEILERATKLIFQGIMFKAIPSLSEEDQNELNRLLDEVEKGGDDSKAWGFLQYKIDGFNKIIEEETQKVRDELLSVVK